MGREAVIDEKVIWQKAREVDLLVESLRTSYTDLVREALRNYQFNFVISDPRLPENPIVFASDGFCKMSGYSREEVLGRNCRFLQGPDTDRRTVLELRDAVREERSAQVGVLNYKKNGEQFWNLFHLAPVFSKVDGTVIHFVGVQTPVPSLLATSVQDKKMILSGLTVPSASYLDSPSIVDEFDDTDAATNPTGILAVLECPVAYTADCNSNCYSDSNGNHVVARSSSGKNVYNEESRHEEAVTRGGGIQEPDPCKPQEPESVKARFAMKRVVSQLVESSKGKGGVLENRGKQISECAAAGVVSSSLMLSLTRIQQSFVLADPNLPDAPIVHASDLFLQLTGYRREEVVGHNCRFLQGPGTDPMAVAQIRESIRLEKSCSVRLLNYRKDKRSFWNLLHVCPIRSCGGKVSFFVGVQLQVSAVDTVEEEGTGMSAHLRQLGAVGAVRVAVRSLQGVGLRRTTKLPSD